MERPCAEGRSESRPAGVRPVERRGTNDNAYKTEAREKVRRGRGDGSITITIRIWAAVAAAVCLFAPKTGWKLVRPPALPPHPASSKRRIPCKTRKVEQDHPQCPLGQAWSDKP